MPDPPVTVWFEPDGPTPGIQSDIGAVAGVLSVKTLAGHCPNTSYCSILDEVPGRLMVITRAILEELNTSGHAVEYHSADEAGVTIHIDHGGFGVPFLTYLVLPMQWRGSDPPGHVDPESVLGIRLQ